MSIYRVGMSAARNARRLNSSNAPVHPGYNNLNPTKQRFNTEDGNHIHVKAGSIDRVAFGLTALACLAAIGFNVKLYWDFAQK